MVPVCSRTRFQIKKGVLRVPSYKTRFLDVFWRILNSILRNGPPMHHLLLSNMFRLNESKPKKLNHIDLKPYITYCSNIKNSCFVNNTFLYMNFWTFVQWFLWGIFDIEFKTWCRFFTLQNTHILHMHIKISNIFIFDIGMVVNVNEVNIYIELRLRN